MGKMQISGRFVGDAYMRPVQFTRQISLPGWLHGQSMTAPYGVAIFAARFPIRLSTVQNAHLFYTFHPLTMGVGGIIIILIIFDPQI